MSRFREWLTAAQTQKSINGWLAVGWFVAGFVGLLFGAHKSIPILYLLSVYAVVAGHWSGWQGGRTEVRQEQAEEQAHGSDA